MTTMPATNAGPGVELARAYPLLPMEPTSAKQVMAAYIATCKAVLVPDDYQAIRDKQFPKRSAMQKLAAAYGVSTTIVSQSFERDDDTGELLRSHAVVRAAHPSGRTADGDGACARTEKRFSAASGRDKLEHDLPATAVTRATNRPVSNLVAFGSMTAEETNIDGPLDETPPTPAQLPEWARPVENIREIADLLTDIFGGEWEPAQHVGQVLFDECDDTIPHCVITAAHAIRDELFRKAAVPPDEPSQVTSEPAVPQDPPADVDPSGGFES